VNGPRSADPWAIERLLVRVLALGGLVLTLAAFDRVLLTTNEFAPWWSALAFAAVGFIAVIAALGHALSGRRLRALAVCAIVAAILAQATVFLGYDGGNPDMLRPWVWALEPIMMCLVALIAPWPVTVGYIVLSTLAPALSGLVFLGRVPHEVLLQTPIHLGNAAFVVIVIGIRSRLRDRERIEQEGHRSAEREARSQARAERQDELSRLVHDEVLSTLVAATRLPGKPVPELRAAAEVALRVLAEAATSGTEETAEEDVSDARERLLAVAERWIPTDDAHIVASLGSLPRAVVSEAGRAMAEALRNSIVHADGAMTRRVMGEIGSDALRIVVIDDGSGFDIEAVPAERLGLRSSILGRMRNLRGGSARIHSGSFGTRIELDWVR
jgi:signal transduction histidine kinase